jgi:hypothetical protein
LNSSKKGRLSQLLPNVGFICPKMEQVFLKTWASLSQVVHTQSLSSIIGYSSHVGNIAPMYATLGHLTERDSIAANSPFGAVTRQPATQILP